MLKRLDIEATLALLRRRTVLPLSPMVLVVVFVRHGVTVLTPVVPISVVVVALTSCGSSCRGRITLHPVSKHIGDLRGPDVFATSKISVINGWNQVVAGWIYTCI